MFVLLTSGTSLCFEDIKAILVREAGHRADTVVVMGTDRYDRAPFNRPHNDVWDAMKEVCCQGPYCSD